MVGAPLIVRSFAGTSKKTWGAPLFARLFTGIHPRTWGAPLLASRFLRAKGGIALLLALPMLAAAQAPTPDFPPPPKDTLPLLLRKLQTTARILHITAHPDDEDGGMLTLESRGRGATVMLLTLTRGEGGQNKVGSSLFDELGILRTLELLESDRYYGVEQRFTRVADFGFSKTPQETFEKWHGHDIALADMVRVIREFQPDVITSRFQGTDRDGHGHHQAAGILAREAFRAAADPNRFPEQLKEGLLPWQAKKFYMDNVRSNEDWTVRFKTSATDPELGGQSYAQVALNGLRHQLSQGAGSWTLGPGDRYSYYKLVDATLPNYHPEHENDFMDGIDTSLVGLAPYESQQSAPLLPVDLANINKGIQSATSTSDPGERLRDLEAVRTGLNKTTEEVLKNASHERPLLNRMLTKVGQVNAAITAASDLDFSVSKSGDSTPLIPGEDFRLAAHITNGGSQPITREQFQGEIKSKESGPLAPGQNSVTELSGRIPEDAALTKQYYHRADPERDTIYEVDSPAHAVVPLTEWPLTVQANYKLAGSGDGQTIAIATEPYKDSMVGVAIVPAFSLLLDAPTQVIPLSSTAARTIRVSATSNVPNAATAELELDLPSSWTAQPTSHEIKFTHAGEKQDFDFNVTPKASAEARYEIRAVLTYKGKKYEEGYSLVGRDDIGYAYYFQPSIQRVSMVDIKLPQNLKIGYLMGAGDDIPTVLRQLGLDVEMIDPKNLASENLSRFGTIILGIRAYDTIDELKKSNQHLLDYVQNGGTLMVQYNAGVSDFNSGNFTPYPLEISRDRVSVEEAPVDILKPADPIFHFPNQITQADFANWVQERNVNVAGHWDSHFEPLLSCHDPNEPARDGGLLVAHYGKGLYIYNTYSFFRQLPSGVPGAVRLYVNLLSAGHQHKAD